MRALPGTLKRDIAALRAACAALSLACAAPCWAYAG